MDVSTKQQRIAKLASTISEPLNNISHHIDLDWMRAAYARTRKDGATGVDGVTAEDYARDLDGNLQRLLNQFKDGTYRAPDVRRVHIPKGDGRTRPLGIPTFEDKVLQRAVLMALEPIYEVAFREISYGFRPGRGPHDALHVIREQLMEMHGGWVVEADIKDCFGSIPHEKLREILARRIGDGVLTRQIHKWLKAGVMEQGIRTLPVKGTPQGGVISPLLSNVYLHYALDVWDRDTVQRLTSGSVTLVRFADDFVFLCNHEADAREIYEWLPKRFAMFGLEIHPDKTRLIPFDRPPYRGTNEATESWDFLGFTHLWAKSRRGYWVIKQHTRRSRLNRAILAIADWCRTHRHLDVRVQREKLAQKLMGHCAYYGLAGNSRSLEQFRVAMKKSWRKWLMRRSGAAGKLNYEWWTSFEKRHPLPPARIIAKYRTVP